MTCARHSPMVREAIVALAQHNHVADVDVAGAHFKISWVVDGRKHMLVISRSPSNRHAALKSRALLKRILRAEEAARHG
jgi:hypothetical protein